MPRCARPRQRRLARPAADPRARAGRQSCRWTGRPPRFASSCSAPRVSSRTACRSDCRSRSRSRCWRCSRGRAAARGPSWPRCCGIRWMTRPLGATCGASCIACARPGCTTCSPPATTRSRWPAAFTAMRRSSPAHWRAATSKRPHSCTARHCSMVSTSANPKSSTTGWRKRATAWHASGSRRPTCRRRDSKPPATCAPLSGCANG